MNTFDHIAKKMQSDQRLSVDEALWLTEYANIAQIGALAAEKNERLNGHKVYFNRNIHIEPTNICVNHCLFCSYRRKQGEDGSWEYSIDQIIDLAAKSVEKDPEITEFHIVGGVHPNRGLTFYADLLNKLHKAFPNIHLKAFTAEEIVQMCKIEGVNFEFGLEELISNGLASMPGGGAEIFDPTIRKKICPDKISGEEWLAVHKKAHQIGIPTNATMLYGHYDTMQHRLEHLAKLRQLQDETGMFNAFIPLKFKSKNNKMSHLGEVSLIEDLKTFAISRIFLDNIKHIKAYWPMLGLDLTLLLLHFGADDVDGTIADSTKIYSMAGASKNPSISPDEFVNLVKKNQRIPIERDSVYNELNVYRN